MYPTFTSDLKVVDADGQGTQAEYVGKELKDIDLIKKFKSIHKRAYGLLGDKEGATVSDILSEEELDFYKWFEWPESMEPEPDFAIQFCELSSVLSISTVPDWVSCDLGLFDITIYPNLELFSHCCICHQSRDTFFGLDEVRDLIDTMDGRGFHCGGSPRCCP